MTESKRIHHLYIVEVNNSLTSMFPVSGFKIKVLSVNDRGGSA